MLQIGSILDRKYKILSEIGHGGMSVVYLAINERAGKTWAVKEVRKEGVIDAQANLAGLVAETNLLKELHHKYLPSIIDVIDTEDSFIIVMDYIEGKDLKKILDTEGAQDPEAVRKWGIEVCEVLGYLHSQKPPIIYRDMKPANLMLKPADNAEDGIGDISLIDFGTARKFKDTSQLDDTKPLGTIGYAAPEQYGNQGQTDARTDIYNTGATLFHLLTGISPADPPYYGVTLLRNIDPTYEGSAWEYIIDKCCKQKREDRYQSCDELKYDLEHLDELDYESVRKRKRQWAAFLASLVLCVLGAVGMIVTNGLKTNASTKTYDFFVDQAKVETSIKSAESLYKQAIRIDPHRPDAYETLIRVIGQDGRLSDEEISVLNSCLRETNGGQRTNQQQLQSADQESYDKLMYQIGIMYFFMHNNNAQDMNMAAGYFAQVQESQYLSEPQRNLASCLNTIGTYYESLGSGRNLYMEDYSYADLWDDLCSMVSGNVSEKVGKPSFAVALYNQMAFQIASNYEPFNDHGVTKRSMEEQLNLCEKSLNEISGGSDLEQVKQEALDMVAFARSAVASWFDRRG